MTNKDNTPIYVQLANRVIDDIASAKLSADDKIPSVRELAAIYEVNANTAMKAIEMLANNEIIYNKRGLGYFVSEGAEQKIVENKRKKFSEEYLPNLVKIMKQLNITFDDLKQQAQNLQIED
ncbi:MAG: GntR family transcriptional regulator [Bacteroidales bacterium]|nr:GntR family transcriptional regulator [Bacteroidales bacterium]